MGYFSNLDIDRQDMEARGESIPDPTFEPDYSAYISACMKDPEFVTEMDRLSEVMRKDIGASDERI